MNNIRRWLACGVAIGVGFAWHAGGAPAMPELGHRSAPVLSLDSLSFKDLNRNGKLDSYEDWRLSAELRARDLVRQMTLEEKAGVMVHGTLPATGGALGSIGAGSGYDLAKAAVLIRDGHVNSMITRLSLPPQAFAEQNNKLQELAEATRLGIPLSISTDPRNHFQYVLGASADTGAGGFTQFPEPLGLAATHDAALVRRFGEIARAEYRAVGLHVALSPQADLATEPRWSRGTGTFGEDADLAQEMVQAYVEGFQHGGGGIVRESVVTVVKHWAGYGAAKEGWDGHNSYGKYAVFPGNNFDYHVKPFLGAFAVHVGSVMPTYDILQGAMVAGAALEPVAAGYNKQLLGMLRDPIGFDGVILSDWAITNDCPDACQQGVGAGAKPGPETIGMPWGVETLSRADRFAKAVNAGIDQVGGTAESEFIVQGVKAKKIPLERVDQAVYRVVLQKFKQGLFENPYVVASAAAGVVGNETSKREALRAQERSLVLLQNERKLLPLAARPTPRRVFLYHVDSSLAAEYGLQPVTDLSDAELALLRVQTPFETLHPGYFFGLRQHEGSLAFADGQPEFEVIKRVAAAKVPAIVTVFLDRPAILTNVRDKSSAILGNFGVSDRALLNVVTGRAKPEGKLPFELPSSMDEVRRQKEDMPHDTAHPLYTYGFGLRY